MTQAAERAPVAGGAPHFGPLYRSLIVTVLIPLLIAQWLLHLGMPTVEALGIAAIVPFLAGVVSIARRNVDIIGVMSFAALVLGVALSFVTGNPVFAIAKESIFTGAFGAVFLGSLAAPRPLIFFLGRQFNTNGDAAAAARWDASWDVAGVRRTMRVLTIGWGAGLLAEAALRVAIALTTPPATAVLLSPILGIAAIGGLVVWTVRSSGAARRRYAAAATGG